MGYYILSLLKNWHRRKTRVGHTSTFICIIYLDDVASCRTIRQRNHIVLCADDILITASRLTEWQRLVNFCETELCSLDMLINADKSACMRLGPRYNVVCSSIVASNQNLTWDKKKLK